MNIQLQVKPVSGVLNRWRWRHPEWWTIAIAVAAWVAMAPHLLDPSHCSSCVTPLEEVLGWTYMIGAMMFPLLGESIQWLASRNYRSRRDAAVALFLFGYLVPWLSIAPIVAWWRSTPLGHHPAGAPIAFAIAAAWIFSPGWTFAHTQCHGRRIFAASGPRWVRDTLFIGAREGTWCVCTCLPLMIGCALAGHAAFAMLGGFALGLIERHSFRPPRRSLAAGSLALAATAILYS